MKSRGCACHEAFGAEDVWPNSDEVAAADVVEALDSVITPNSGEVAADSVEVAAEDVAEELDSVIAPDSVEVAAEALDSVEAPLVLQDSVEAPLVLQDSVDMVPDSLPPGAFTCGSCHLVHEDREAWNRAHSRFYPCTSCGLIHADYDIDAFLGYLDETIATALENCERFAKHYPGCLPTKKNAKASKD